jgi:hypothetical protein
MGSARFRFDAAPDGRASSGSARRQHAQAKIERMMKRALRTGPIMLAVLALASGCVARAAYSVATAPVRVASKTVDLATTSREEADRNRGRAIRERDEKIARLERSYDRHMRRCNSNDEYACDNARDELAQIQGLKAGAPAAN